MQFLLDMREVYPGIVDGEQKAGLELVYFDPPTVQSEGLEDLVPPERRPEEAMDEELSEISDDYDDVGDPTYDDDEFQI